MQLELDNQAKEDLAQWGLCMRPRYLPGYASMCAANNDVKLDIYGNTLTITEDYAEYLDTVVSELEHYNPMAKQAAKLHFVSNMPYRDIAAVIGVNKDKVGNLVNTAVSWVARSIFEINSPKAA